MKRRGAHVAVNAAGDREVEIVRDQAFGRRADGRHRRCAGRVDNVVGTVEVEDVRNAAGNAVGQFAGHGVFGDIRDALADPVVQFPGNVAAHRLRQRSEAGTLGQFVRVFRKVQAQGGEIVLFSRHGIAEDHRRAIGIQRPLGIAVVFQRFARAGNRPFLRFIHRIDRRAAGSARRHLIGSQTNSRTQPPILE